MKKIFEWSLVFLFFVSCQSANTPEQGIEIVKTFPDGSAKMDQIYEIRGGEKVMYYQREYFEDGNLMKEGPLLNGKMDGLWKSYHKSGILWSEGEFTEGTRNGISNTYHPNGNKYYEGFFKDSAKDSTWRFWREDGTFIKEINFSKK